MDKELLQLNGKRQTNYLQVGKGSIDRWIDKEDICGCQNTSQP